LERALAAGAKLLGINNRDLRTFETSLAVAEELLPRIPGSIIAISESGIHSSEDTRALVAAGARGFLIGESLMRAEDPAETLEYSYQKQIELLQNVKKGIADVVTSKKRLQLQEQSLQQQVVKLDTQARQALAAGKEDLARMALERKNVAQTELQGLDTQVAELEDQQQKLTDSEQKLRAKIEAFRTKKEVIKAQYSAAEAQVQISDAATGVGEQMADVGLAMQRAIEKTEDMRARGRTPRSVWL